MTAAAPGGGAALGSPTVGVPAGCVGAVGYVGEALALAAGKFARRNHLRDGSERNADHRTHRQKSAYAGEHPPTPHVPELANLSGAKRSRQPASDGNFSIVSIRSHSCRRRPIAAFLRAADARRERFRERAAKATPAPTTPLQCGRSALAMQEQRPLGRCAVAVVHLEWVKTTEQDDFPISPVESSD